MVHNLEVTLLSKYKYSSKYVTPNHLLRFLIKGSLQQRPAMLFLTESKVLFCFFRMMKIDNNDHQNKFYHNGHKMRLIYFLILINKTPTLHI